MLEWQVAIISAPSSTLPPPALLPRSRGIVSATAVMLLLATLAFLAPQARATEAGSGATDAASAPAPTAAGSATPAAPAAGTSAPEASPAAPAQAPSAAPPAATTPSEPGSEENITPAARIALALRKGDKTGALKIADEFLATRPRDAQMRFLRAVVLGDLNRTDEAVAALESLTEDFPELPEPYNNLAVIRANQGKLAPAERYLQLAIAAQPNYVTARENLGDLYISMAAAAYAGAARLEPENLALKKKLTMTRELGGKLRSAR